MLESISVLAAIRLIHLTISSASARLIYIEQLLIKLIAFGVMLGLAGLNRFYLTPALSNSVKSGDAVTAGFAVRNSIGLALALATSALALMAWLGTLDPNA